ncbi:hypothetical protein E2C01_018607 [Portunus trituberculatus]|uniref:Uncharacterized protein n=1 Tax=Portunus trituberculatus TaxID=210409 RepID=A0A5B7DVG6_PORTR|nr:hypothetical protein [Portunus trituberculatus]
MAVGSQLSDTMRVQSTEAKGDKVSVSDHVYMGRGSKV